ncbi:PH domain-containing protein [Quadrisphaera sp. DSM 44207]|uniref:PH domain-containing protein n=1 Tax=Quadrisphaera sp. DSM 44207 TaxID=1881057 RepID=UPI0008850284|nr:PH domain-containing protein [Quadrisphaera sp. DSM 44207]SDQ16726.1 putative membrane protein [Quadrisphaera sp. DSM 44207]
MSEPVPAPAPPEQAPVPAPAPPREPGWRRLHPVTPVLRSWRVLVVLLVLYAQQRGQGAVGGVERLPGGLEVLVALGVLALAALVAVAVSAVSWRTTRYAVDAEAVRLHSGVLVRQQRSARLDRLQAVDVVQPLLARLLGFAELRLEVAGGSGSDIRLAYLREPEAQRLRNLLLARSAGLATAGEEAPEAVDRQVLVVPVPRLAASLALSSTTAVLVVGAVLMAVVGVATRSPEVLLAAAPAVLGLGATLWTSFTRTASWRVAIAADGLRLRSGLLESRSQTLPPGRVQAVRLAQPLLWRRPDWWRLQVNVAGYGTTAGADAGQTNLLVPVATRAEAEEVLGLLVPDLPVDALERGLDGASEDGGWTSAPRRARRVDPVAWRRSGVRVVAPALLVRRGRLRRELDVVPHAKPQSLGLQQGPLQRRLGLATVAVHSTPGPVRPTAAHLDTAVAVRLIGEQAERSRRARAGAGPERWMERPPDAATRGAAPLPRP